MLLLNKYDFYHHVDTRTQASASPSLSLNPRRLALLACHPATLEAFFEVELKIVAGVEHMVVGTSLERSGVRDCAKLRSFILDGCRHALSASQHHTESAPLPLQDPRLQEVLGRQGGRRGLTGNERQRTASWNNLQEAARRPASPSELAASEA